jgi:hypothetical protein
LKLKKLRLYLDTSVFGGVFDAGFDLDSKRIFDAAKRSKVIVLISELIMEELRLAPAHVQELLQKIPENALELVGINSEVLELRNAYLKAKILDAKSRNDATHAKGVLFR